MAKTRMLLTTAVLAAVAALLAGPANAKYLDYQDGGATAVTVAPEIGPGVIPYMSHGIGVDESLFSGEQQAQPGDPGTIPYLSHGIGVDESIFAGEPSPGLSGDSPRRRVSVPGSPALTGDSALTRYPAPDRGTTVAASSGDEDSAWTAFGLGAAMGALVAAGLAGVVLTVRHRGRVALP